LESRLNIDNAKQSQDKISQQNDAPEVKSVVPSEKTEVLKLLSKILTNKDQEGAYQVLKEINDFKNL